MKRIFIAIKIVPQPELLECFDRLKERLDGEIIKWVEEENLHLTINFIGEILESKVDEIIRSLQSICNPIHPFSLRLKGLGTFGAKKNPRVVFVKINEGEELGVLGGNVNSALYELGIQKEIKFIKPHLTLGRIKSIRDKSLFCELIVKHDSLFFQEEKVTEITLYESILQPHGPVYIPLQIFRLTNSLG